MTHYFNNDIFKSKLHYFNNEPKQIHYYKENKMFENLLAEMTRKRVTKKEMASILKMSEWTFLRKLNGESQFTFCNL